MSQVIYSQPGWSSPFLGRGNSVGPPALSGVIMFSVKHNQSPRSQPLYKPRGPPINTGWLGDLSSQADHRLSWGAPSRAEPSEVADSGRNPDADVRWPAREAVTDLLWANMREGKEGGSHWRCRGYLHHLSSDQRQCVNVAKRKKFMVVCVFGFFFSFFFNQFLWQQTRGYPWERSTTSKECKAI